MPTLSRRSRGIRPRHHALTKADRQAGARVARLQAQLLRLRVWWQREEVVSAAELGTLYALLDDRRLEELAVRLKYIASDSWLAPRERTDIEAVRSLPAWSVDRRLALGEDVVALLTEAKILPARRGRGRPRRAGNVSADARGKRAAQDGGRWVATSVPRIGPTLTWEECGRNA